MRCSEVLRKMKARLDMFLIGEPLSPKERAISESIKALKTLEVRQGRVSVDPSEVIDRQGYLDARRKAAGLVSGSTCGKDDA